MKLLLDIEDQKALHLVEVLKSLPYVKTQTLTEEKAEVMADIKKSVDNLKLVKEGKLKPQPIEQLIDEL